jgi:hypothetical protein
MVCVPASVPQRLWRRLSHSCSHTHCGWGIVLPVQEFLGVWVHFLVQWFRLLDLSLKQPFQHSLSILLGNSPCPSHLGHHAIFRALLRLVASMDLAYSPVLKWLHQLQALTIVCLGFWTGPPKQDRHKEGRLWDGQCSHSFNGVFWDVDSPLLIYYLSNNFLIHPILTLFK